MDQNKLISSRKASVPNAYTPNEVETLTQYYPACEKEIILHLLPKRSWASIRMKASKLGISRRTVPTKALGLFKTWNQDSAWLFGVLFPKSSIKKDPYPQLVFWSTRKSLVKQVASALGICSKDVGVKFTNVKTQYFVTIENRELSQNLAQRGLVRLKKMRKFPNIPKEFIWHFLRGFFDCESSIIPSSRRWGVGFARKDVVEKVRDIFYEEAGIENLRTGCPYKIFYSPKGHHWYFRIGSVNLLRLYQRLYDDIDHIMYDRSKKKQFDNLLNISRLQQRSFKYNFRY